MTGLSQEVPLDRKLYLSLEEATQLSGLPKAFLLRAIREKKLPAAQPKTAEGRCQRRGGILYKGECYVPNPSSSTLDEATCHMRGGLYIAEKCLMAPQGRSAF